MVDLCRYNLAASSDHLSTLNQAPPRIMENQAASTGVPRSEVWSWPIAKPCETTSPELEALPVSPSEWPGGEPARPLVASRTFESLPVRSLSRSGATSFNRGLPLVLWAYNSAIRASYSILELLGIAGSHLLRSRLVEDLPRLKAMNFRSRFCASAESDRKVDPLTNATRRIHRTQADLWLTHKRKRSSVTPRGRQ